MCIKVIFYYEMTATKYKMASSSKVLQSIDVINVFMFFIQVTFFTILTFFFIFSTFFILKNVVECKV